MCVFIKSLGDLVDWSKANLTTNEPPSGKELAKGAINPTSKHLKKDHISKCISPLYGLPLLERPFESVG
jgi:hypothetical protein